MSRTNSNKTSVIIGWPTKILGLMVKFREAQYCLVESSVESRQSSWYFLCLCLCLCPCWCLCPECRIRANPLGFRGNQRWVSQYIIWPQIKILDIDLIVTNKKCIGYRENLPGNVWEYPYDWLTHHWSPVTWWVCLLFCNWAQAPEQAQAQAQKVSTGLTRLYRGLYIAILDFPKDNYSL